MRLNRFIAEKTHKNQILHIFNAIKKKTLFNEKDAD